MVSLLNTEHLRRHLTSVRTFVSTMSLYFSVLGVKPKAFQLCRQVFSHWPAYTNPMHVPLEKAKQQDISEDSPAWVQIPALGLISCVSLDKFLKCLSFLIWRKS